MAFLHTERYCKMMIKKRLKGGSLSATYLVSEGTKTFIRKEASLTQNREYGFQRWYSQLKRVQRYSVLFPGVFPNIIKYGQEGDFAYFNMEYVQDSMTAHEFLINNNDLGKIENLTTALLDTAHQMHKIEMPSNSEAMQLYIYEEVEKKIADCYQNDNFAKFIKYDEIYFNKKCIPSFHSQINKFYSSFSDYVNPVETFTHGNLTLENILYVPKDNKIVFIDPYEENIVDSILTEYSQIYQSCSSKYELYNSCTANIMNNHVDIDIPNYDGLNYFNDLFTKHVINTCDEKQYYIIRLLEISQFLRMLPFKMVVDENKMIFFYALASKLFHNLQDIGYK